MRFGADGRYMFIVDYSQWLEQGGRYERRISSPIGPTAEAISYADECTTGSAYSRGVLGQDGANLSGDYEDHRGWPPSMLGRKRPSTRTSFNLSAVSLTPSAVIKPNPYQTTCSLMVKEGVVKSVSAKKGMVTYCRFCIFYAAGGHYDIIRGRPTLRLMLRLSW